MQGHARLDPEFIRDLFAQFRPVTIRRMFGGAGLFADGVMFGLVVRDVIYFKVDESSIADFEREAQPTLHLHPRQEHRPRQPAFAALLALARAAL